MPEGSRASVHPGGSAVTNAAAWGGGASLSLCCGIACCAWQTAKADLEGYPSCLKKCRTPFILRLSARIDSPHALSSFCIYSQLLNALKVCEGSHGDETCALLPRGKHNPSSLMHPAHLFLRRSSSIQLPPTCMPISLTSAATYHWSLPGALSC